MGSSSALRTTGSWGQSVRANTASSADRGSSLPPSARTPPSSASVKADSTVSFGADSSQAEKPGTGDRVAKVLSCGSSRLKRSTTCLIRYSPKLTPLSPRWVLVME